MFNFAKITLVKQREAKDNFVGIRKSASDKGFEFCLPNGFDDFPDGDFDQIKDLFFRMYRTFNKFERDNRNSDRFNLNKPEYQEQQDQTTLSSGGVTFKTDEGESCVIYSKIKMIEKILSAYDDLSLHSIQRKISRSDKIDYSQIYKYLDRAIYLVEDDIIHIETMDLPRPLLRYESTDLIDLYCFILDEIIQQLEEDAPDNVKSRSQDIKFFAQRFKENYLTSNQSIFDKDTYEETINILKETLDHIDNCTYYKDADYWQLYEAIETFLYGELNPQQQEGEYWGIKGFSFVWEDMCHTYFFRQSQYFRHTQERSITYSPNDWNVCYADTDISLKGYQNPKRTIEEKNRVGNYSTPGRNTTKDDRTWIYCTKSDKPYPDDSGYFWWSELLCIEFNSGFGTFLYNYPEKSDFFNRNQKNALRRFPRPDLVLQSSDRKKLRIIDFKDVPIKFFERNQQKPFEETEEKYRIDVIKQLTYELALQQNHLVRQNWFLIPCYITNLSIEFLDSQLDIKGIQVRQANFAKIQTVYLGENL